MMKDFAAIDFETANECRSSVGVEIVRDGLIADSFYSLISPEPEYYQWFCRQVHGLGPEDTEGAPVFPDVWAQIAPKIEGLPLVAHNSRFDEGCLKEVFREYRMDYPDYVFHDSLCVSYSKLPWLETISCIRCPQNWAISWRTIIMPWQMPKPAHG